MQSIMNTDLLNQVLGIGLYVIYAYSIKSTNYQLKILLEISYETIFQVAVQLSSKGSCYLSLEILYIRILGQNLPLSTLDYSE